MKTLDIVMKYASIFFLAICIIMGVIIFDKSETIGLLKEKDDLKISLDNSMATSYKLAKTLSEVNFLIKDNVKLITEINNILVYHGYKDLVRVIEQDTTNVIVPSGK